MSLKIRLLFVSPYLGKTSYAKHVDKAYFDLDLILPEVLALAQRAGIQTMELFCKTILLPIIANLSEHYVVMTNMLELADFLAPSDCIIISYPGPNYDKFSRGVDSDCASVMKRFHEKAMEIASKGGHIHEATSYLKNVIYGNDLDELLKRRYIEVII